MELEVIKEHSPFIWINELITCICIRHKIGYWLWLGGEGSLENGKWLITFTGFFLWSDEISQADCGNDCPTLNLSGRVIWYDSEVNAIKAGIEKKCTCEC